MINGMTIEGLKPHEIVGRGLVRTFQNPQLFGDMTVRENVLTGMHSRFGARTFNALLRTPLLRAQEAKALRTTDAILARVGLFEDAEMLASSLAYGKKRLLEVARCLGARPSVLILDEPAAGMSEIELAALSSLIRELNSSGMTILLIEHHLAFLFSLVDTVTVLDHGTVIFDGSPEAARRDQRVIDAYLGNYIHA